MSKEHSNSNINSENVEDIVQEYISFVSNAMSNIKHLNKLIVNGSLNPLKINLLLAEYGNILFQLTTEEERYLIQKEEYEKQYNAWFDKKYIEIRDKINADRLASKLATKEEIHTQVRVEYAEEYEEYKDIIDDLTKKERFYTKLIKRWEKIDGVIKTLSYNMQTELKKIDMQSVMKKKDDKNESNVRRRRS